MEEYRGPRTPAEELQIYTWYTVTEAAMAARLGFWLRFEAGCDSCYNTLIHVSRMDATLKEIATLIKEVNVAARRKGARISIATVYKDG